MNAPVQTRLNVAIRTRADCRLCGSQQLTKVWSFGKTPLANNYLTFKDLQAKRSEPLVPLEVYKCADCHLVQLRDVVDPEVLFRNYLYVSSTSPAFVAHFQEYAQTLRDRFRLSYQDLVVDVGSNDGVLLKPLKAAGIRVLGIEPSSNIAQQANNDGLETVAEFFIPAVASRLKEAQGSAKVISANNVFAHTDNVDDFVKAVKILLADDGVFVFEVQYLGDLLGKNLFDIVYHEHLNYYHLHPLLCFFPQYNLEIFDVERHPVHGGSIRVYVRHVASPPFLKRKKDAARLRHLLEAEEKAGLNTLNPYQEFAQRIEANKKSVHAMITDIKARGQRLAGYGAPAKATTLCYAFDLDGRDIDYIVDDSPLKQGRLMPGTHIPIVTSDQFKQDPPDYCLILAWNFAEAIMKNHTFFGQNGGQWIIPVPQPRVV